MNGKAPRDSDREGRSGPISAAREHLMPSGKLPGTESSETVWTGCDGPGPDSGADQRAKFIGAGSWLLVGGLAIWLHVTQLDSFVEAFPLVLGLKLLVFLWVLFGVSLLRPLFIARSKSPGTERPGG